MTMYAPEPTPWTDDLRQIREWLSREFLNILASFETVERIELPELHNAPDRPRDGMIKFADGTDWNPGSGVGFYGYRDAAWHKLDIPAFVPPSTPDLDAIEAISTTGILVRTATNTWGTRTLVAPAAGITITNPAGIAGDPTFALANDLAALEGLAGTGFAAHTAANTWAERTLTAPAAGLTITNPAGVAGNPTFALANDLAALEGLGSTGIAARTATDTWAQRTMTGTANKITVTNGDGVSGNPTFTIPDAVTLVTPTITGLLTVTGGQVAFPSTQAASSNVNTLDDYEEGTWTPALNFGGGTTGITYATQAGTYIKIGKLVTVWGTITLTNKGSSAGNAQVSGLPFFADASGQNASGSCGAATGLATLNDSPLFFVNDTTGVFRHRNAGATGIAALMDTNFTNTTSILFSASFLTTA